jgi:hypothetical protein
LRSLLTDTDRNLLFGRSHVLSAARVIARLHEVAQVVERNYDGAAARFKARIPPHLRDEFAPFFVRELQNALTWQIAHLNRPVKAFDLTRVRALLPVLPYQCRASAACSDDVVAGHFGVFRVDSADEHAGPGPGDQFHFSRMVDNRDG